jgi:DNA-binding transcriptional regulator LsrR (DeoR family)
LALNVSVTGLQALAANGAVGNICLHFYDARGKEIEDPPGTRVFGLELARLKSIPRVVGIAWGSFGAVNGPTSPNL